MYQLKRLRQSRLQRRPAGASGDSSETRRQEPPNARRPPDRKSVLPIRRLRTDGAAQKPGRDDAAPSSGATRNEAGARRHQLMNLLESYRTGKLRSIISSGILHPNQTARISLVRSLCCSPMKAAALTQRNRSCLLPIHKILFQDEHVFIYSQDRCHHFSLHELGRSAGEASKPSSQSVSRSRVKDIFRIVSCLLTQGYVGRISPAHLGVHKHGHVVLRTLSLRPLELRRWRQLVLPELTRYVSLVYAPLHVCRYMLLTRQDPAEAARVMEKEGQIPPCFLRLLKAPFDRQPLYSHTEQCMRYL